MEVLPMDKHEMINTAKDAKEIEEFIKACRKLQEQINNPTRDGMIEALSTAQGIAGQEITELEISQGDIYPTLWLNFQDGDLYRKLSQYQQGLYNHVVKKLGGKATKELLKDYIKANQSQ